MQRKTITELLTFKKTLEKMETKDLTLLEKAAQFSRKSNFDPYKAKFEEFRTSARDAESVAQYIYNRNFAPQPFNLVYKEDLINN